EGNPVKGPAVHTSVLKVEKQSASQRYTTEEGLHEAKGARYHETFDAQYVEYLESPLVSPKVKAGLRKATELFVEESDAEVAVKRATAQLREASDDQSRLRANLQIIPQTAEPYKNFLNKFVAQETVIENLQRDLRAAQTALDAAQRAYEKFSAAWSAE